MKLGYYPGCALKAHSSSLEYGMSTEALLEALEVDYAEVPDWNCCGASAGHMTNSDLTRALNVRNLHQAEDAGMQDVLAPCPLCAKEMALAHNEVTEDPEKLARAQDAAECAYRGTVRMLTLVQYLHERRDLYRPRITDPFPPLRVACYYGCLHTRPPSALGFDDAEQPTTMEAICADLGLEPVAWSHKTECCGAGFTMSRPSIVARLTGRILRAATEAGAETIVAACPMCHANLDMRQSEAAADAGLGDDFHLPILYLSQAVGLAVGVAPDALSLGTHFVDTSDLVARLRGEPLAVADDEAD